MARDLIYIETLNHDMLAVLKNLPYTTPGGFMISKDSIARAIEKKGICHGVKWKQIEKAIETVHKTKKPLQDLVIAKAMAIDFSFRIGKQKTTLDINNLKKLQKNLKELYAVLSKDENNDKLLPGFFFQKKEIVFEIQLKTLTDVYGKKQVLDLPPDLCNFDETLELIKKEEHYQLTALKSGYLTLSDEGKFSLFNPFQISEDKSNLFLRYYPIKFGHSSFQESLEANSKEFKYDQLPNLINSNGARVYRFLLKSGKRPITGRDAELEWHVNVTDIKEVTQNESVDYKSQSPYKKVKKGDLLLTKKNGVKGEYGLDIYQKEIIVPLGKEITIHTGDNIEIERTKDYTYYRAADNGIFYHIDHSISVEDTLIIEGDVDFETGNIEHNNALIIEGDIKSNFSVTCAKKLVVRGNVENGAQVICEGDAYFCRGISGDKTKVQAKGDFRAGFVNDATIVSTNNITIQKYAFNSNLYARNQIIILGESVRATASSLVGGLSNALISMDIHSIGGHATQTKLILGFDLHLNQQMEELKLSLPSFNKKLVSLQESLGNKNSSQLMADIKKMSPQQKKELRDKLMLLKEVMDEKIQVESNIQEMAILCLPPEDANLFIISHTHIKEATIKSNTTQELIKEPLKGYTKIKYREDKFQISKV